MKYRVIDNQQTGFMDDTHDKPMNAQALRSRFWSLDEARTTHYKHFTLAYIAEVWDVDFERVA